MANRVRGMCHKADMDRVDTDREVMVVDTDNRGVIMIKGEGVAGTAVWVLCWVFWRLVVVWMLVCCSRGIALFWRIANMAGKRRSGYCRNYMIVDYGHQGNMEENAKAMRKVVVSYTNKAYAGWLGLSLD